MSARAEQQVPALAMLWVRPCPHPTRKTLSQVFGLSICGKEGRQPWYLFKLLRLLRSVADASFFGEPPCSRKLPSTLWILLVGYNSGGATVGQPFLIEIAKENLVLSGQSTFSLLKKILVIPIH